MHIAILQWHLDDIHYHGHQYRDEYDCERLLDYYVCRYSYKYCSEMIYALRQKNLSNYPYFHILSLGCGGAPDLMAFEYMNYEQSISYIGVDKNEYWGKIHNYIEENFRNGRAQFRNNIDVLTYFDLHELHNCNVIILQYVISFFYDVVGRSGMQKWFSQLAENIVRNKPNNSPLLIIITSIDQDFLKNVSEVLENARKNVKTAVNLSMVYAYYEIGRMIVEEEQHGQNRAAYGKQIVQELSNYLAEKFGKGFSTTNLKQMRQFYIIYSQDQISQTLSDQFENLPAVNTGRKFYLSWSHYLKLMRIDNADERHFYEIESVRNDWSLSELKRQYDSSLYERLALSTNKDKVYRLALEGQKVETAKDAVKDPYVLEFLGLKELPEYSESELESRIIDNLQQFLLELGTGFAFIGRQVRFTFDEEHFMVDLVFYNRLLRCFVLFDLKIGELKHQDIGQMQMYVHYYDRKESAESKQRLPFMNRICMPLT